MFDTPIVRIDSRDIREFIFCPGTLAGVFNFTLGDGRITTSTFWFRIRRLQSASSYATINDPCESWKHILGVLVNVGLEVDDGVKLETSSYKKF